MVAFKLIRNGFFITSRNLLKQLPVKILAHLKLPKNRFVSKIWTVTMELMRSCSTATGVQWCRLWLYPD